mgnify:FL=1
MSATILNEIRKGYYLDSVGLMRMSKSIVSMDGVEEAAIMMGSPSNRQIMTDAGLLTDEGKAAEGGDLIIGIRANTAEAAKTALTEANFLLDQPTASGGEGSEWHPKTLRAALKSLPEANLALISVPGDLAVAEARKAIRRGLHAMIFSDNVSLDEEASLKQEARELGQLVMGPDCGTAIINGTPLAFANAVTRGDIGVIGASGTGTQEVTCLIAQYGGGISHAIGVGGRDLKTEIGGISSLMALDALDEDPETKQIVFISKPPPADIATKILERIGASNKPATVCFIGADELPMPANAVQVFTLRDAAKAPMGLLDQSSISVSEQPITVPSGRSQLQGLFTGGTLCAEAQIIFRSAGVAIKSNAPIPGVPSLTDVSDGYPMLDLGADEYTQGKPHPMIDPTVRDDAIIAALGNDKVAIILVDVVIGYGSHQDPAGYLADLLNEHGTKDSPAIIASVTGTKEDPQVRSIQMSKLTAAGIVVAPTNADASEWALAAIRSGSGG